MPTNGELLTKDGDAKIDYLRLALAFKSLGGGLWDYDIDAAVLSCSERFYEILGIEQRSTPIRSIQALRLHIHPDDAQRATKLVLQKLSQWLANEEICHIDFRVVRPVGEIRWIRSMACFIRDADSAHRKAIGCVADITEFTQFGSTPVFGRFLPRRSDDRVRAQRDGSETIFSSSSQLTEKEKECLRWVSLGKTASESGIILGRSSRTVEFHLNNAVRKLGVVNKIQAVAIAIRMGMI
jgi:PAS domain S-box-containing protein